MKFIKRNSSIIILTVKITMLFFILFSYIKLISLPEEKQFKYAELNQGSLKSDLIFSYLTYRFPDNCEYYRERSVAYNKRGLYHQAFTYLDKAVQLKPVSHLGYRGWIKLYKIRDYQGALNDFIKLDSLTVLHIDYPMSENIHMLKAICLFKLNKRSEALKEFDSAVKTTAKNARDYKINLYYAIALFEIGDLDESLKLINQVLEDYPKSSDANYYLGKVLYEQKKYSAASIYLKKAKDFFLSGNVLKDTYNELPFEIYMEDIDEIFIKNEKAKNRITL